MDLFLTLFNLGLWFFVLVTIITIIVGVATYAQNEQPRLVLITLIGIFLLLLIQTLPFFIATFLTLL